MSDASARLERALSQTTEIKQRAGSPYERTASAESLCPACQIIIIPGDKIASPAVKGTSWRHLGCAICQHCGSWLTEKGVCDQDCTAGQAEPETGSWHDVSLVISLPSRAYRTLANESTSFLGRQKLPSFRVLAVGETSPPQRAATMSKMRLHLQFFMKDAPNPNTDVITREAVKNTGIILGNEYRYWDVIKISCDMGDATIENAQQLMRPPAWFTAYPGA